MKCIMALHRFCACFWCHVFCCVCCTNDWQIMEARRLNNELDEIDIRIRHDVDIVESNLAVLNDKIKGENSSERVYLPLVKKTQKQNQSLKRQLDKQRRKNTELKKIVDEIYDSSYASTRSIKNTSLDKFKLSNELRSTAIKRVEEYETQLELKEMMIKALEPVKPIVLPTKEEIVQPYNPHYKPPPEYPNDISDV